VEKILQETFASWLEDNEEELSGVFSVFGTNGLLFQQTNGHRNKAEELPNTADTAFGIASGTKLFTGLAVCKLIDEGKLSLEDKICDILSSDLGQIDKRVTVFHLLTHTSGVGDYIDEDAEDSEENIQALYDTHPVQLWTRLEYYLQMITPLPPKFEPGERYSYSNSGFVLLGLVVEAVSGLSYQQFVLDNIITACNLTHTGFYRMDSLPPNTALGYLQDEATEEWRTNIFSMPILGGSDGGLFTCANDLEKLWRAVFSNKILSEDMTAAFLKSYQTIMEDEDDGSVESYGLGIYSYAKDSKIAYFAVGGDSGVGFCTAYYPASGISVSCFSNTGWMAFYCLIDSLLDIG